MAEISVAGLADPDGLGPGRWKGKKGRLEVWYLTFTADDGTGYWLHFEAVAPDGDEASYSHGWAAVFPVDGAPTIARFGPAPATPPENDRWFDAAGVHLAAEGTQGTAGTLSWDLTFTATADESRPLYTFPRTVWHRELLPGAQIVPWPRLRVIGSFAVGGRSHSVAGIGGLARIYGHGNAERWCWLHADLGDGAVLEVVSATSRRSGLRRLPMIAMLQLRVPGQPDWPRRPLVGRTRLAASGFRVTGRAGRRRIRVEVDLPSDRTIALGYTDPDGATATCTNTERGDATVEVERWSRGWQRQDRWELAGTAHAEIGRRP